MLSYFEQAGRFVGHPNIILYRSGTGVINEAYPGGKWGENTQVHGDRWYSEQMMQYILILVGRLVDRAASWSLKGERKLGGRRLV